MTNQPVTKHLDRFTVVRAAVSAKTADRDVGRYETPADRDVGRYETPADRDVGRYETPADRDVGRYGAETVPNVLANSRYAPLIASNT